APQAAAVIGSIVTRRWSCSSWPMQRRVVRSACLRSKYAGPSSPGNERAGRPGKEAAGCARLSSRRAKPQPRPRRVRRRFPNPLRDAGLIVQTHDDHFASHALDEPWLSAIGKRGWVAITKDERDPPREE